MTAGDKKTSSGKAAGGAKPGKGENTGRSRRSGGDPAQVAGALRELAEDYARVPHSDTARLREVLDDVEAALAAGATYEAVLKRLHAQGFTFKLSSFSSTLGRLRRERRERDEGTDRKK